MHSYSLTDSPSSAKLNQQISHSQVTKQYLEEQNNKLIETLNQLIQQSDPKQKYGKIVAGRAKEINELKDQNRKLFERNRMLERKLHGAQEEIKRLNKILAASEDGAKIIQRSPSDKSNDSSSSNSLNHQSSAILPEHQKELLQAVQIMHQQAQQLVIQQQTALKKCVVLLEIAFQKLDRMLEFQKISMNSFKKEGHDSYHDRKEIIQVQRQKYEKLINYYVQQSLVFLQGESSTEENVKQFSADDNPNTDPFALNSMLTNAHDLQKLFTQIAHQKNLQSQWQQYLANRKQEGEKFKLQIQQIYKGYQNVQQAIHKEIDLINKTMSTHLQSSNLHNDSDDKNTLGIIKSAQNKIQDELFKKLIKLVNRLQFTEKQKELFKRFDQKRKCGRFFDAQQFLQKFKTRQDVTEISQQYSLLMIKVINSMVLKAMEILCQQPNTGHNNVLDESPLKWLKFKLDNKFIEIKKRLFDMIEKQSQTYLYEKHKNLNQSNSQKIKNIKQVQPLPNPKFDQNKQLEKELVKIIYEYKQVLESCVMNTNKKIFVGIM